MQASDIYWAGYPRRRLPRIRITSSTHSIGFQARLGNIAAQMVYAVPLGADLDEARRLEHIKCQARSQRAYTYSPRSPTRASFSGQRHQTIPRLVKSRVRTFDQKGTPKDKPQFSKTNWGPSRSLHTKHIPRSPSRRSIGSSTRSSNLTRRSPSEIKALNLFARELEKHLVAQEAIDNSSLRSWSPAKSLDATASCYSIDTIIDFLPYLEEFQAADLAVTSAQQRSCRRNSRGRSSERPVHRRVPYYSYPKQVFTSAIQQHVSHHALPAAESRSREESASPRAHTTADSMTLPWLRRADKLDERTPSVASTETCITTVLDFEPYVDQKTSGQTRDKAVYKYEACRTRPSAVADIVLATDQSPGKGPVDGTLSAKSSEAPQVPTRPPPKQPAQTLARATRGKSQPSQSNDPPSSTSYDSNAIVSEAAAVTMFRVEPPPGQGSRIIELPSEATSVKGSLESSSRPLELNTSAFLRRSLGFRGMPKDTKDPKTSLLKPADTGSRQNDVASPACASCGSLLVEMPSKVDDRRCSLVCKYKYCSRRSDEEVARGAVSNSSSPTTRNLVVTETLPLPSSDIEQHSKSRASQTGPSLYDIADAAVQADRLYVDSIGEPREERMDTPVQPGLTSSTLTSLSTITPLPVPSSDTSMARSSRSFNTQFASSDVLAGLKIALAASLDKTLDRKIEATTGLAVRKFLADLSIYDGVNWGGHRDGGREHKRRRQ